MEKIPLSVCIIAHNEEDNIRACLESVKWADEIIVVDDYSDDNTAAIAREYTDRVIFHAWPGHVEQKNFCLEQGSRTWALCIDADERVSPELREEIQRELSHTPAWDGFYLPRKTRYLGRWIIHGGWYPNYQLRLFRREKGRWGGDNPHDHVTLEGRAKPLKGDLYHYTYDSIADHIATVNSFTSIAARVKKQKHVRFAVLRMLLQPPGKFFKMYVLKFGFLDGIPGLIVAAIGCFYVFLKYAKLWEMRGRDNSG